MEFGRVDVLVQSTGIETMSQSPVLARSNCSRLVQDACVGTDNDDHVCQGLVDPTTADDRHGLSPSFAQRSCEGSLTLDNVPE